MVMRGDKDCCSAVCSGADDAEAWRGGGTVSHTPRIDPTTHHSHNRGCEVPVASSLARAGSGWACVRGGSFFIGGRLERPGTGTLSLLQQ